jgi:hypothetical protein
MSFLSSTAVVSITNSCDSLVPQKAYAPNPLEILPEDVFVKIFSYLSESMCCTLSSVSKKMNAVASSDSLWASIARPILLPQELEARHNIPYKDYSKDLLCLSKIGPANANKFHILMPRSPALVDKINQVKPPHFILLKPKEAQAFLQEKDSALLIKACTKEIDPACIENISHFCFKHITQQKIGKNRFDFFNCTDYLISFDEDRTLWIDNKKTRITFTEDDCQLLIYKEKNYLHIFDSDLGKNRISHFQTPLEDIMKENPQDIRWFYFWDDRRVIVKDLAIEVKKRVEFWSENHKSSKAIERFQQQMEKIHQLNVPNFHLLNKSEIDNLMDHEHTINLIAVLMFSYIRYPSFTYATQQKIGPYQIDTFNSTSHVIHVNAEGELFLNNQRILNKESQPAKFGEEGHRQFFIYGINKIFYKKVGDPNLKQLQFDDQEGRIVKDLNTEGQLPKCTVYGLGIVKGVSAVPKDDRKINEYV